MGYEMTPTDLLADRLGISEEAVALARSSPFVDLHIDSFIWTRFVGYDLNARHTRLITGGRYAGHLDFPRAIDAGLSGGLYTITTNPFRSARGRWATFNKNLARLSHTIDASGGKVRKVTTWSGYQAAVADGAHAAMIKIQGGNALSADAGYAHGFDDDSVLAITVVHLTHNTLGRTSTPLPGWSGPALTAAGHDMVRSLNERRIFVDLAHIHPDAFWDIVGIHDRSQPLIDTHTGVDGTKPHWRNLDDKQLRAIADTGGVVGVIFEPNFLQVKGGPTDVNMVVDAIDHIVKVVGDDVPAIGTDYDGMIDPPPDLRDGLCFPRLVQAMLDRGYSDERIAKILGGNFLRALKMLRP
jgi:membrane dipeptidase